MGHLGPLLVLLGAAIVSGNLLQKLHQSFPYPPLFQKYGLAKEAIIEKEYAPQFFTPSLIPSPIYVTSDDLQDCDHPNEQPAYWLHPGRPIEEKIVSEPHPAIVADIISPPAHEHLVIPEAPVLPPLNIRAPTIPTFAKVTKPVIISDAPHLPHHSLHELPTGVIDEEPVPLVISEAPVLPPLVFPGLPMGVENQTPDFVRCIDVDQKNSEPLKSVVIPEAPFLPYFTLSEPPLQVIVEEPAHIVSDVLLPELVDIPEAPVLPPLLLPEQPAIVTVGDHIDVPIHPELPPYINEVQHDLIRIEEPSDIVRRPLVIPKAPVLPPLVLSELPVGVEYQTPNFVPCIDVDQENSESLKSVGIPKAPFLPSFTLPELPVRVIEEEPAHIIQRPLVIPKAPVLPPLVLPEHPVGVEYQTPNFIPVIEVEQENSEPLKSVVIPEAPFLPSFTLPEPPVQVIVEEPAHIIQSPLVIPKAPLLPPLVLSELPVGVEYQTPNFVPCIDVNQENSEPLKSVIIPDAPYLPSFRFPELPVQVIVEEPAHIISDVPQLEHVVIPEAPVLPPLSLSEQPVIVTVDDHIALPTNPELPPYIIEVEHDLIPEAPELPPLVLPETPVLVAEVSIPAPMFPPLYFPEVPRAISIAERTRFDATHPMTSSPMVIEAPVQLVIQGSKHGAAECDTIINEHTLPNILEARKELRLPPPRRVVALGPGQ